ncbi:MAG: 50S ribosomal protein L15 [Gemmatimonas sp.]|nr:50S ribosomal protein L15 [Gemmatimonas sp.]
MDGLHNLPRPKGSHRDRKRVGRGPGSGTGKTAGYGHKGAKARTGSHGPGGGKPAYEGGQMPLQRRLPKRGFASPNRVEYQVVNLYQLEAIEDEDISLSTLAERGLVRHLGRPVKILGTGTLSRKVTVTAHAFSKSAREKIEGAGGSVEELA